MFHNDQSRVASRRDPVPAAHRLVLERAGGARQLRLSGKVESES